MSSVVWPHNFHLPRQVAASLAPSGPVWSGLVWSRLLPCKPSGGVVCASGRRGGGEWRPVTGSERRPSHPGTKTVPPSALPPQRSVAQQRMCLFSTMATPPPRHRPAGSCAYLACASIHLARDSRAGMFRGYIDSLPRPAAAPMYLLSFPVLPGIAPSSSIAACLCHTVPAGRPLLQPDAARDWTRRDQAEIC